MFRSLWREKADDLKAFLSTKQRRLGRSIAQVSRIYVSSRDFISRWMSFVLQRSQCIGGHSLVALLQRQDYESKDLLNLENLFANALCIDKRKNKENIDLFASTISFLLPIDVKASLEKIGTSKARPLLGNKYLSRSELQNVHSSENYSVFVDLIIQIADTSPRKLRIGH